MTTNAYAYLTADYDCDGVTYAIYRADTFAAQNYFAASEGHAIDRATFERDYWPKFDTFERDYWREEGYCRL